MSSEAPGPADGIGRESGDHRDHREDWGLDGPSGEHRRNRVKAYDVGPDARVYRSRAHRRRRLGRHRRRAYIRSVYFLPSLATLGNAVCGFGAMYVAAAAAISIESGAEQYVFRDPAARFMAHHGFVAAAYLIFVAMIFDALDGRLARFTRHTTDFGGQLDSLADVVSFGAAPAFIALQLFRVEVLDGHPDIPIALSRLNWAIGALFFSCAAFRLARFNVSNEHGEQHHFSFLGLPSPGAGGAVCAWILMQQDLRVAGLGLSSTVERAGGVRTAYHLANACVYILPAIVLGTGLLMISNTRYPHVVNRFMRGKKSIWRLVLVFVLLLLLVVWHQYVIGIGMLVYAFYGFANWLFVRIRRSSAASAPPPAPTG
jgi:CDP-diacylglycerol--serine O-phosphatidyltransferase